MSSKIKNVRLVTAEALFETLKKGFAAYLNEKLDAAVVVEFSHVFDMINVSFPEIIDGAAFYIVVSTEDISISANAHTSAYNSDLLETHLNDFLYLHLN